jgi:hypothetical protein
MTMHAAMGQGQARKMQTLGLIVAWISLALVVLLPIPMFYYAYKIIELDHRIKDRRRRIESKIRLLDR